MTNQEDKFRDFVIAAVLDDMPLDNVRYRWQVASYLATEFNSSNSYEVELGRLRLLADCYVIDHPLYGEK